MENLPPTPPEGNPRLPDLTVCAALVLKRELGKAISFKYNGLRIIEEKT
jgi:hypothetical protein